MKIKLFFLVLLLFCFNAFSQEILDFYFDSKHMSYKDKFINELAIKYNFEYKNFGVTTIGRVFDVKSDYINLIFYYNDGFNLFEISNYNGISDKLQAGISSISRFTNENDYIFYTNNITNIISRPTVLSNQNLGIINNLTKFNKTKHNKKLNYVANINDKLSIGITYINKYKYYDEYKKYINNVYEYGINYNGRIKDINFNTSFIGENTFNNDFNSYDFGFDLSYFGILLGGNYGFGKNLSKNNFSYYSYGIGYEIKSIVFSIWHMKGDYNFNYSNNFDISYNINKNIKIYSNFSNFKINLNKGKTFNIGIVLKNF